MLCMLFIPLSRSGDGFGGRLKKGDAERRSEKCIAAPQAFVTCWSA